MGISSVVAAVTDALATVGSTVAAGAADVGLGATAASTIPATLGLASEGALTGGALGALTDWKNPLKGAEYGAITGGTIAGAGPLIGSATGLGATASDVLAGAAGGTLGGLATGRPLGISAGEGAIGGLATGLAKGLPGAQGTAAAAPTTSPAAPAPGAAGSAAATAAPASVPAGGGDVTTPSLTSGGLSDAALPGTVAKGAAAGGAAGGVQTSPLGALGKKWGDFLTSPQALLSIGGMAAAAAKGTQKPAGVDTLTTQANQLLAQGNRLDSYLETGTLPPGLQQSLTTATQDAQTAIKSQYASMGMSGSSAEQQDLQNVALRAQEQGASQAMQLMQMGTQDTQLGTQLYEYLIGVNMQQDQQLSSSIGNFVSAMAQMGRPVVAQGVGS
jgi:hypothetical protein